MSDAHRQHGARLASEGAPGSLRKLVSCALLTVPLLSAPGAHAAQTTVSIASAPAEPATPHIGGTLSVGVHPNTPFQFDLSARGARPMTFSAQNLPPGLELDASLGRISGTVASGGDWVVKLHAENSAGSDDRDLMVSIGDQIALTPPMGWNSYDAFDDSVTEAETLAQATWIHDNLKNYGWRYVVVDFRWYDPNAPGSNGSQSTTNTTLTTDASGRFQPAPNRFPSAAGGGGFKALATQIHALGLQFGIHIMRGIPRKSYDANTPIAGSTYTARDAALTSRICHWNTDNYGVDGNSSAGQAWYDSIFAQYADWGVDFVKVDDMTSNPGAVAFWVDELRAISGAIAHSGRSITLSLSPGETPWAQRPNLLNYANMWRASDDFWDRTANLEHAFDLANTWQALDKAPGHWPDQDMLPLGFLGPRCPVDGNHNTRFTRNEQVAMLSLWSILPSPLIIGANLAQTGDPFMLALLSNEDAIAINQDVLGNRAQRVLQQTGSEVWVKDLSGGRKAIALFNRSTSDQSLAASFAQLGLSGPQQVRDVWARADLGVMNDQLTVSVPWKAAALLITSAPGTTGTGGAGNGGSGGDEAGGSAGAQAGNLGSGGDTQAGAGGTAGASAAGAATGGAAGTAGTVAGQAGVENVGGDSSASSGATSGGATSGSSGGASCGCSVPGSGARDYSAWLLGSLPLLLVATRRRRNGKN